MAEYEVTTAVQYSTIKFYVVNTINALCLIKNVRIKKKHTNHFVSCLFDLLAFSSAKERAQCFALGLIDQGELCLHLILHNWKQKVTSHSE